ncbi:MAG: peptidoglycan DD-metalloendopeptidase family protein [Bacteroidales bacterium]|nr:peptidoglycan DD-metalloendopeptidase family protein [Bacteroidales bacterium]
MKIFNKKVWIIVPATIITLAVLVYFYKYHFLPKPQYTEVDTSDSVAIKKEVIKLYGIPVDSFEIIRDIIKPNQMLLALLSQYNLPEGSIAGLISKAHPEFDVRKIRAGNNYTIFLDHDTLSTLRYLVYEHTPTEYVLFSFGDSVNISMGMKEVRQVRKSVTGKIKTSLWNAMIDINVDPVMANELSDIYAWTIDFFGLQVADSFAVVFDQQYVDTLCVGLGKIYAAYFKHAGTEFYAIPFVQDSVESYYDLEGNSLRKTFLKAPLSYRRISSGFSYSRLHPILKIRRPHHGVDYAAPLGTPVHAIGDGKIIKASRGYNKGAGNMIKIKHNSVYTTAYLHLYAFAKGVKVGKYVRQGDIIGYVGTTGLSTGPHLDFRFYKNGKPIDPLKVKAPPVEPVHEQNLEAFKIEKNIVLKLLSEVKAH